MKNSLVFILLLLMASAGLTSAQDPIGKWQTIDDETGEAKSIVEIYEKDGKLFGKVVDLLTDSGEDNPLCEECPEKDPRYNQPILGMDIIKDLEKKGEEWEDGTVLDPEKGKVYDCKIWLADPQTLKLRGYVAFFYRTQTWKRLN